jgi:hypothetical protein
VCEIAAVATVVLCAGYLLHAAGRTRWDAFSVSALWGLLRVWAEDRDPDE